MFQKVAIFFKELVHYAEINRKVDSNLHFKALEYKRICFIIFFVRGHGMELQVREKKVTLENS